MFNIMIPEPAAFLLDSVTEQGKADSMTAPDPPLVIYDPGPPPKTRPLTPADLSLTQFKQNPDGSLSPDVDPLYYGNFLAKYGVVGVDAPTLDHVTVSRAFSGGEPKDGRIAEKEVIEIPEGYEATTARVIGQYNYKSNKDASRVTVFIGDQVADIRMQQQTPHELPLKHDPIGTDASNPETTPKPADPRSLPIAINTWDILDYAVSINVQCRQTDAALESWKVKTHSAIIQAFLKQQSDYEEKLAARAFQQGALGKIGGNPDQNRRAEQTEIKKGLHRASLWLQPPCIQGGHGGYRAQSSPSTFIFSGQVSQT